MDRSTNLGVGAPLSMTYRYSDANISTGNYFVVASIGIIEEICPLLVLLVVAWQWTNAYIPPDLKWDDRYLRCFCSLIPRRQWHDPLRNWLGLRNARWKSTSCSLHTTPVLRPTSISTQCLYDPCTASLGSFRRNKMGVAVVNVNV